MSALSKEQIHEGLKEIEGWAHAGKSLHKRFSFKTFMEAIGFVNSIAEAAERAGHHPDMTINYNAVSIALSTHSEGGVTSKDFQLAKEIDTLSGA